jgi:hypothetical protein
MRPFSRAILHFGADKTGSRSIQAYLDRYRDGLLRLYGVGYPPGRRHARLGSASSTDPARFILNFEDGLSDPGAIAAADGAWLDAFESWLRESGGGRTLVLSYEGFLDVDAAGLVRLRQHAERLAEMVTVVVYVRPPLSYARSALSQRVRTGRPAWRDDDPPVRPHAELLGRVVEAFGHSHLEVRPFLPERLAGGDVVLDFCTILGLDAAALARLGPLPRRLNESLGEIGLACGEALRETLEAAGWRLPPSLFEDRFGARLATMGGEPLRLVTAQIEAVLRAHAPHGVYLRERFGIELAEDPEQHLRRDSPPAPQLAAAAAEGRRLAAEFLARRRLDDALGSLACPEPPRRLAPGETAVLRVALRNGSTRQWLALGPTPVRMSYHWWSTRRSLVEWDGRRSDLPVPRLGPGESVELTALVEAPRQPGDYLLQLVPLQEGCAWLDESGFTPAEYPVTVG